MPTHKAFESAGKRPGLQIWRVEKMDLGEVPAELHGSFYMGDSYIVLHTSRTPSYNVHTWIGTTHARTPADTIDFAQRARSPPPSRSSERT